MIDAPYFEVVTPAANAAARRLTTVAYVSAVMTSPPADAVVEALIDEATENAVSHCRLATNAAGSVATFAAETLRATWSLVGCSRGTELLLPWRVPVTSITSIVENDETLTAADYRVRPGATLERLSDGVPIRWSSTEIVVTYIAGWASVLSTNAPAALQAAIADQVKYRAMAIDRDRAVRSEAVPDVYSASYAVPGGDSIGVSGLFVDVEAKLTAMGLRNPAII